ncbi:GNAT family N-acetyltransferase [Gordonia sp. (in: high G+C Gram-positive bacteria)]|uniref:GNAT family N-acetyltransferase n=1 Tax=Gordonia sp. (in: high G+C Gram-positive bacteria) TaxID=84139 RepID=UPI001D695796|nr:GNAT family N-acetyltransferase [Gordonia sp. (in: high G+C Gram-positive bacteria)]MCB1293957.1 GNAT family N-acetyltransferase [Gordonia sp. (in: high G+C Gram-positive bacteria)]HMS75658.1 GNAT family N-acetyltransferase [Gordonia sp. (in: high G+C Gram-positive bacteria)]HQV18514.1 GNAT family N-acetyltransferase [Gordonia sp. (in: high G+C Gram-positive bacteria)]
MTVRLVDLRGQDSRIWLEPALDVYVTAMSYPDGTQAHRAPLWREHITRPGWRAVGAIAHVTPREAAAPWAIARRLNAPVARADDEILVGIAYGYRGARDQWWNQQLRHGLRHAGAPGDYIERVAADYFELTELHVHPSAQGAGIGGHLLTRLLADRPEASVLLSTPENPAGPNRAWSLYRRMGFADVLRNFTFAGDPRPFAFLGRPLPLLSAPEPARRR